MSDGDILRASHADDINSGYLSEGGASAYAKRMQQRFREGMQAVKECMEKSSNILDTDRYVTICILLTQYYSHYTTHILLDSAQTTDAFTKNLQSNSIASIFSLLLVFTSVCLVQSEKFNHLE